MHDRWSSDVGLLDQATRVEAQTSLLLSHDLVRMSLCQIRGGDHHGSQSGQNNRTNGGVDCCRNRTRCMEPFYLHGGLFDFSSSLGVESQQEVDYLSALSLFLSAGPFAFADLIRTADDVDGASYSFLFS